MMPGTPRSLPRLSGLRNLCRGSRSRNTWRMPVDVDRIGAQHHVEVAIYRDAPWLPRFFGNKYIRPVFFRSYATNCDWRDPRTLLAILMDQTRFDHIRGQESDLAAFSMDVWVVGERADPGCEPLLRSWRYTPQMYRTPDGATFAA